MNVAQPVAVFRIPQTMAAQRPVANFTMLHRLPVGMINAIFHLVSPGKESNWVINFSITNY
jgi:hypothetical protein